MALGYTRHGSRWEPVGGGKSISNYAYLRLSGHAPEYYGERGRARAQREGIVPPVRYRGGAVPPLPRVEPDRRLTIHGNQSVIVQRPVTRYELARLFRSLGKARYYTVAVHGEHGMIREGRDSPEPGSLEEPVEFWSPPRFFSGRGTIQEWTYNAEQSQSDDIRESVLGWWVREPTEMQITAHE